MFVKMFIFGMYSTNCYLIGDTETREAAVVDPSFEREPEAKTILNEITRNNFQIKYIINTHGHPDHTSGDCKLKEATKALVLIHEHEAAMLSNPSADRLLHDGDLIEMGSIKLRVIHTPGHSPGSIILLSSDAVFSGDTLFAGSIGRYDLPGGSGEQIASSLKNKLLILPDRLKLYPGHGPVSTIGEERRHNPFLQNFNWTLYG